MKAVMRTMALAVLMAAGGASAVLAAPPLPGAIFTTDSTCTGVNINIYSAKDAVYLDGGPAHPGAAGLPDGDYFVQVTDPSGATVLGKTLTAAVSVSGGEFAQCYQLSQILLAEPDFLVNGYSDTPNNGGEYKVWVSTDGTFTNNSTKTDNFKVKPSEEEPEQGTLEVIKFYDANANGINDDNQLITGWQIQIKHDHTPDEDHTNPDFIRDSAVSIILDPGPYVVTESTPVETNWLVMTPNPVSADVAAGETTRVEFGNLCLGGGGGKTLGFWSNKNGQATMTNGPGGMTGELAVLSGLNLRNANGTDFNPTTYAAFRTWLLSASATNMAYMLSAQLSATSLNVLNGGVSAGALVHAPGCGANGSAFITIGALTTAANDSLAVNGLTVADSPERANQECLKNALDRSNNNLNFVQSGACAFSFAE